jgi:C_GCAxxG_C_C family probable redox protein
MNNEILDESAWIDTVKISAETSFASGLLCAESVVMALAKAQGIDSELLPKVATAFCSGMSRTCGTCGALTGAMMGISIGLGRSDSTDSIDDCYAATQLLINKFEQEFGSRECHVLLGCDISTPAGMAQFKEKKLTQRCTQFTGKAAEIAAKILFEKVK